MADRVLVAISKYYKHISDELEAGALEALEAAGAKVLKKLLEVQQLLLQI